MLVRIIQKIRGFLFKDQASFFFKPLLLVLLFQPHVPERQKQIILKIIQGHTIQQYNRRDFVTSYTAQ